MSIRDEINKAISAHGMWKIRLQSAIGGNQSEWTVEKVQPDNVCDFGKWLYSLPASERTSEHWKKVQALHADFHKETARVLGLATHGKTDEARAALSEQSLYMSLSGKLTMAMMGWLKAVS